LLLKTSQLSNIETASKRTADTGVIMNEIMSRDPDSTRTIDSVARVNYLHDRYRKAGKISDDDMLYTLSLFALEPVRWIARHEWRSLNEIELCAMGVFWKDVGEKMDVPYGVLGECKDGIAWIEALDKWSTAYEENYMLPEESNRLVAQGTLYILLFNVPVSLRPFVRKLISGLLQPRLRTAIMLVQILIPLTDNSNWRIGLRNPRACTCLSSARTLRPSDSL
jgi:hypothetical protein